MLVPVQYQRLMAEPVFDRHDLSSFRMKLSTSAPFGAELKAQVLDRWPGELVEFSAHRSPTAYTYWIAHTQSAINRPIVRKVVEWIRGEAAGTM